MVQEHHFRAAALDAPAPLLQGFPMVARGLSWLHVHWHRALANVMTLRCPAPPAIGCRLGSKRGLPHMFHRTGGCVRA